MNKVELPDIDKLYELSELIRDLSFKKGLAKLEIQKEEANITREATNDKKWFVNNKPPSQTYIDNAWKFTGFDGNLLKKREELNHIDVELDDAYREYELLKLLIEIWRTQSANERNVLP